MQLPQRLPLGVREYDNAKRHIKIPKGFSQKFNDEWDFLIRYTEKEVRHPLQMCIFRYGVEGLDPKTCYYLYDTYGRDVLGMFTCSDPVTVQRVLWGKQLVNLTVDMWSEDINSGLLFKSELTETLSTCPKWVEKNLDQRTKSV